MRLYTLYLRPLGEVTLHLNTTLISGCNIFVAGYTRNHERIDFKLDKLCYLEDSPDDYGYCHIVSYTKGGTSILCNTYKPLM